MRVASLILVLTTYKRNAILCNPYKPVNTMLNKEKLHNISKLSFEDCQLILHEIEERWGVVQIEQYCDITGKGKRATYYNAKDNRIKQFDFGGKKHLCIND